MHILITGGTGFIGSVVAQYCKQQGHTVIIITRSIPNEYNPAYKYITRSDLERQQTLLATVEIVIHLAGYPISARRTPRNQQKMKTSRVDSLLALKPYLTSQCHTVVSASAIGYYPSSGQSYTEAYQTAGGEFLSQLCQQREQAAHDVAEGRRLVILRFGNVLGDQGLLSKLLMTKSLKILIGFGDGSNMMSWIDVRDLSSLIMQAMGDVGYQGAYNAVTPSPVSWNKFNQHLIRQFRCWGLLRLPAWLVKVIFGQQAVLFLGNWSVVPERLLDQGFVRKYQTIEDSLKNLTL